MIGSKFLRTGLKAIKRSEVILKKYFNKTYNYKKKSDGSIVTPADIECEEIIKSIILKDFPSHQILGEELINEKKDSKYLWIIDPIDGTKNFLRKLPLFATEIALLKKKEFIMGISNAPMMDELLYAEKNLGAYCNRKIIRVSKISNIKNASISYGNLKYFNKLNLTSNFVSLIIDSFNPRGFGDAWSYHLLAQGKIDAMIEANINIWDIAAFVTIIKESGGIVTDLIGNPISLKSKTIIASNGKIHNMITNFFKESK